MSRSYKKTPVHNESYGFKTKYWYKRQASKTIRRCSGSISDGSQYKKLYCSWFISDYRFYRPWHKEKNFYKEKKHWAKDYYYK